MLAVVVIFSCVGHDFFCSLPEFAPHRMEGDNHHYTLLSSIRMGNFKVIEQVSPARVIIDGN